ncbi:nicotinate-nucleotide--dimethylbenzimidazole phosphoribosyltransferase [Thiocapsa rosea]|uniref:nicotinate-nucleotide--dimethylbenzimidazole phosphoribosyltransferase n=1 Tax=Thiocapsa rosea TaxID=69360 RepID=UPI0011C40471|nr:hypothetical protein [Thiocapsa rosea]
MCVDSTLWRASGSRVLLVELDSEAGAFFFSGEDQMRVAVCSRSTVADHLNCPEDDTDLEIEILRLRVDLEMCSNGRARVHPWICGEHPRCRLTRPLDKHRLDVALSAGRHAAERAKLAGVAHLIGVAPSVRPVPRWWLRATDAFAPCAGYEFPCLDRCLGEPPFCFDPYDALRCRGRPEIAALVGVAIAAAQMGIPFCLPDPAGEIAVDAAVGLNPGVRAWLDPISADRPGSVPAPMRPRSLCAL